MKPPKFHILVLLIVVAAVVACAESASIHADSYYPQDIVICIDPGHPSTTSSGKAFQNGLTEVDVNWKIALKLEKLLKTKYGIKTVKTRKVCRQVMANKDRALVANRSNASLFLRLHCDTGKSNGFAIYYPNRKGEHDGRIGPDVHIIESSRKAAYLFHKGMAPVLRGSLANRGVKGENYTYIGSKQGALTGSVFSQVPTITVEMLFLSSKKDARFIKSQTSQKKMTQALAEGVRRYLDAQCSYVCR